MRYDILRGVLRPGSRLAFADLNARYDASTGVLREVLPRLVEQGLATAEPQLGYRVVTVSVEDLKQLTQARITLETLVARIAIESGNIDYEAGVLAAHHALSRTPLLNETGKIDEEWIIRHEAFHHAVLAGCENEYLLSAAERLRTISAVYRYWTADESERVHRDLAAEHLAICDAAVERDGDRCVTLLAAHIQKTTELLLNSRLAPQPGTENSAPKSGSKGSRKGSA